MASSGAKKEEEVRHAQEKAGSALPGTSPGIYPTLGYRRLEWVRMDSPSLLSPSVTSCLLLNFRRAHLCFYFLLLSLLRGLEPGERCGSLKTTEDQLWFVASFPKFASRPQCRSFSSRGSNQLGKKPRFARGATAGSAEATHRPRSNTLASDPFPPPLPLPPPSCPL